jgi:hypothetical protein
VADIKKVLLGIKILNYYSGLSLGVEIIVGVADQVVGLDLLLSIFNNHAHELVVQIVV